MTTHRSRSPARGSRCGGRRRPAARRPSALPPTALPLVWPRAQALLLGFVALLGGSRRKRGVRKITVEMTTHIPPSTTISPAHDRLTFLAPAPAAGTRSVGGCTSSSRNRRGASANTQGGSRLSRTATSRWDSPTVSRTTTASPEPRHTHTRTLIANALEGTHSKPKRGQAKTPRCQATRVPRPLLLTALAKAAMP